MALLVPAAPPAPTPDVQFAAVLAEAIVAALAASPEAHQTVQDAARAWLQVGPTG